MHLVQKRNKQGNRKGFTLVEVMIALAIVSVAVYMLSSTITATMVHSTARKERTLSIEAAMNVLERMRAVPFVDLYRLYNDDPEDDPLGPGTAPGDLFDVPGLKPRNGAIAVGSILLPALDGELRENLNIPELSLPRDLNGDLIIDSDDHAGNYKVLPVQIKIEWTGTSGDGHQTMFSMLSAVQKHLR